MHELSIAMSILEGVEEEVARQGYGAVRSIHVRVGALSGVAPEALRSAFELAREQTPFAACGLAIDNAPAVIRCAACGVDRPVFSIQSIACPVCERPPSEIVGGRELEVTGLELEA